MCKDAKYHFSRVLGLGDPSLVRLMFGNKTLSDAQNVAYLESSKECPIIIIIMMTFSILIGKDTLHFAFTETELVAVTADLIAEHIHKNAEKPVAFFALRADRLCWKNGRCPASIQGNQSPFRSRNLSNSYSGTTGMR
jgi:hypothetical protein